MANLLLFCNVEHLKARDDDAGATSKWTFSLNVSVAVDAPIADLNLQLLQPWLWTKFSAVRVWKQIAAATPVAVAPADVELVALQWQLKNITTANFPNEFGQLSERLGKEFLLCAKTPAGATIWNNLTWESQTGGLSAKQQLTSTENKRPWSSILGQTSTLPPPFPQLLNLTLVFRVPIDNTPGEKFIYAAPVIPPTGGIFTAEMIPKADPPVQIKPGVFRVEYSTETQAGVPMLALMAQCKVQESIVTPSPFLNLSTQWVKKLASKLDVFEDDWRALLEQRIADSFDLTQRIIEFLRANRADANLLEILGGLQNMAIVALRDIAGIGIDRGPNGRTLLDDLLIRSQQAELTSAERAYIGAHQIDTVGKWKDIITKTLPQLDQLRVLKNNEVATQLTIEEALAELDQLHQVVLDPQNLILLMRAQLKSVSEGMAGLSKKFEALDLTAVNLRQQLALENIGFFWKFFISSVADPNPDGGQSLISQNYTCFLQAYFLLRFGYDLASLPAACGDQTLMRTRYNASPKLPRLVQPVNDATRERIRKSIDTWAKGFATQLMPKPSNKSTDLSKPPEDPALKCAPATPTDVPHAITLQVDSLAVIPGDNVQPDQQDLLNRISGVGVLLRKKPSSNDNGKGWVCLNMGAAAISPDPTLKPVSNPNSPTCENSDYRFIDDYSVMIPSRLNYQNELRQAFISYNNHPLTAESPVACLANFAFTDPKMKKTLDANDPINRKPVIKYRYSKRPDGKIIGLSFGTTYDFMMFCVSNAGTLPRALAPDSMLEPNLTNFSSLNLSDHVRSLRYLRKVRVGQIRAFDEFGKQDLTLPSIPDQVFPRARDMRTDLGVPRDTELYIREEDIPAGSVCGIGAEDPFEKRRELPLVLLAPSEWENKGTMARSTFKFSIRKPATDLNTWDRWLADVSTNAKKRERVWGAFYCYSEENRNERGLGDTTFNSNDRPLDTSLDDPAVANHLYVGLWDCDGAATNWIEGGWLQVTENPEPMPNQTELQLQDVQSKSIPVECKIGVNASSDLDIPPVTRDKLTVTVGRGKVCRLAIYSCISLDDYVKRFDNILPLDTRIIVKPDGPDKDKKFLLVSAHEMVLEGATDQLLDSRPAGDNLDVKDLYDGLQAVFSPTSGSLDVTLKPVAGPAPDGFSYLHRAELLRQVWRWQGREPSPHPAIYPYDKNKEGDYKKAFERWQAWEFGNRWDTDHLLVSMNAGKANDKGRRNFHYKEILESAKVNPQRQLTQGLSTFSVDEVKLQGKGDKTKEYLQDEVAFTFQEILEGGKQSRDDLRALQYRFCVRVFSRYYGIMPLNMGVAGELTATIEHTQTSGINWKPCFVPCRKREPIPPPKVKLILPLTESFGQSNGKTPGLLVVLDEPWFEVGGLGESLRAEVVLTASPDNNPNAPAATDKFYYELGNDPTIDTEKEGLFQTAKSGDPEDFARFERIRGPVGHYFDRTNEAPLFTATSFILPAPSIARDVNPANIGELQDKEDSSWDFCKVRLQRRITVATNAKDVEGGSLPLTTFIDSEFTDPYWVQYLPEFSIFEQNPINVGNYRIAKDSSGRINLLDKNGAKIVLQPTPSSIPGANIFRLYLILTRRVFDATGRQDQEVFLDVCRQQSDTWLPYGGNVELENIRGRIIEVQCQPTLAAFGTADQLWSALFEKTVDPTKTVDQNRLTERERVRIVRISEPIERLGAEQSPC